MAFVFKPTHRLNGLPIQLTGWTDGGERVEYVTENGAYWESRWCLEADLEPLVPVEPEPEEAGSALGEGALKLALAFATATLAEIASVLGDPLTASGLGPHLTCTEANRLAEALASVGLVEEGSALIVGHAAGDDDELDVHYGVTDGAAYLLEKAA